MYLNDLKTKINIVTLREKKTKALTQRIKISRK